MAAFADTMSIDPVRPTKIITAMTAPGTQDFIIPEHPNGGEFTAIFQAVGTVTALTAALQIDLSGGTNFVDYIAAASFISNTTPMKAFPASSTTVPLVAGARYRFNATAVTGSIDIWVCVN